MTEIDQSANGREIHLSIGDELRLSLPENRSGGYKWELVTEPGPALRLVSDTFDASGAPRLGSPGARRWIFKACELGRTTLQLESKRSWEDVPSSKGFVCNVVIQGADD